MSIGDDNIGTGIGITSGGAGLGAASGLSITTIIAVLLLMAGIFFLFIQHRARIERRIHAQNQSYTIHNIRR